MVFLLPRSVTVSAILGGKALISNFACFGKTFRFACFSIPMLRFPRYMENVGWIKCPLRWDPGLHRGGKKQGVGEREASKHLEVEEFCLRDPSLGGKNGSQEAQREPTHPDGKQSC